MINLGELGKKSILLMLVNSSKKQVKMYFSGKTTWPSGQTRILISQFLTSSLAVWLPKITYCYWTWFPHPKYELTVSS
jgi:hypothetical protein